MGNGFYAFVLSFFLFGCASALHVVVDEQIKPGDSESKVREVLGPPQSFSPSRVITGGTDWTYQSNGSVCTLTLDAGKVSSVACDSSNYVSPGRRAMKNFAAGFSEGMKNSQSYQKPIHCSPDLLGGYNCR